MATAATPTAIADPAIGLGTPILDAESIRSVNFFNGRLLTSRDLGRDQDARRQADARLGQAIGAGVVRGLEVQATGDAKARRVRVSGGLAVNRAGQTLRLAADRTLALVAEADAVAPSAGTGFGACGVLAGGTYVAGDGLYLLMLAPASAAEGKAQVLALDPGSLRCNTDATVEAVQLRLLKMQTGLDTNVVAAAAVSKLRNALAYACFGAPGIEAAHLHPGAPPADDPLAQLRAGGLSDCDVPLAVVFVTESRGIVFVERWAVRRRVASHSAAPAWQAFVGEEPDALADAQLLQFQEQVAELPDAALATLAAAEHFVWLPPAGFLDAAGARGVDWRRFLGAQAPERDATLAPGDVRGVLAAALRRDAVRVGAAPPRFRVYRIAGSAQWLFVREAPNAPHAEEVWFDGARADLAGADNVQAAVEALERRLRCCARFVFAPPGADISDRLAQLAPGDDATLCFEAGDFDLEKPIELSRLGHLTLQGAGAGTRLRSRHGEYALAVDRCAAVTVHDLAFEATEISVGQGKFGRGIRGALSVFDTPIVHIERVRARCAGADALAGAAIVVNNASPTEARAPGRRFRVTIASCEVAVGWRQVGILCVDADVVIVRQNLVYAADVDKGRSCQRGIVVAGNIAREVRIEDNVVDNAVEGIAVGLSRQERAPGLPLRVDRAVVARNSVQLLLGPADVRNRFGLFLGNAGSALVNANRVTTDPAEARLRGVEGLRLSGVYGMHLAVRDNHFLGTTIGIRFDPQAAPGVPLPRQRDRVWLFEFNVAENAAQMLVVPDSVREVVIDEHNFRS